MARKDENVGFVCAYCQSRIEPLSNGSYRNHCPFCLYSLHVDIVPGDRASPCRQLMKPIGLVHKGGKGWQIVHACTSCGHRAVNRIAVDTIQSDDYVRLASL